MTTTDLAPIEAALAEMQAAYLEQAKAGTERAKALEGEIEDLRKAVEGSLTIAGRPFTAGQSAATKAREAEGKALIHFARTGDERELKALSVGHDPDGGYLVGTQMEQGVRVLERDQTVMRRLARVVELPAGDRLEVPIDDSELDAVWVGEQEARPATTTPEVQIEAVPLDEIYSLVPITQKLLDVGPSFLMDWVQGRIADKFGRAEGQAFLSGNGVKKPRGLLSYPTATTADFTRDWGTWQYQPSGAASTITSDSLIRLKGLLRTPYRRGARWLMNRTTETAVSLLKDGEGRYLWAPGLADGAPNRLLGHPVELDEGMADVGAGEIPIAFGDFGRAYTIVDRPGMRMLRDPFTAKPSVLIYSYKRTGGRAVDFHAVKMLKVGES
jgi:HK97 family phage major capsid protein